MDKTERARRALGHFQTEGTPEKISVFGNGHINDTYLVEISEGPWKKLILQRMNTEVFREPEKLMENVLRVTSYLGNQIKDEGGDPERETLHVICTTEGKPYYRDEENNYYRLYRFISGAVSRDTVTSPQEFYESGVAFGHFQYQLSEFPPEQLHEVIPDFHNTKARFERFCQVVQEDPLGRAAGMEQEIRFVMERKELAEALGKMRSDGRLPLRVTHNDTKLNNIMLDEATGKAVCILDLDTVMPGLAAYDFGDAIRFGASTAAEDETDLTKVSCDLELFRIYLKGYLEGCRGTLTEEEVKTLPLGALTMTLESGIRFLTDYLEGDVYFKIHREGHNRDRCRTQFRLVEDMERKYEEMKRMVWQECGQEFDKSKRL